MKAQRVLAWIVFAAWLTWATALHAWLGQHGTGWLPDLGLVLVFSLLARLEAADAPWLMLATVCARAALAVEGHAALAAGVLGLVPLVLWVRGTFELTAPAWRTLFCGLFVLGFDAWLLVARHVRGEAGESSFAGALLGLVPIALVSALLSLCCGPLFASLPGLTPLRRRTW